MNWFAICIFKFESWCYKNPPSASSLPYAKSVSSEAWKKKGNRRGNRWSTFRLLSFGFDHSNPLKVMNDWEVQFPHRLFSFSSRSVAHFDISFFIRVFQLFWYARTTVQCFIPSSLWKASFRLSLSNRVKRNTYEDWHSNNIDFQYFCTKIMNILLLRNKYIIYRVDYLNTKKIIGGPMIFDRKLISKLPNKLINYYWFINSNN